MYLYKTYKGAEAREFAQTPPPFGLGIYRDVVNVETIEHHASSFTDAGDDYNVFRLFDKDGVVIEQIRREGY